MGNYKFEKLNPNQFERLVPLMQDCFGMDTNIEYFKWKFIDNPAGKFVGFIAIDEETNETAAYYGAIAEEYIIDGKKQRIYQSCDTMTHSNHRRKGLFKKLALKCYEDLENNNELFIIGFGGGQSTPGFLKFGWKHVFNFRNLFLPKILCYPTLLKKTSEDSFEAINDLAKLGHLFVYENKNLSKIHSLRNIVNIKWRYKNPLIKYKTIAYKTTADSRIEGYITFYTKNEKLFIFDFIFETKASRKCLLNKIKRKVIEENLSGVIAFCQENSLSENQLKRSGFLINPFGRGPLSQKTPFIFFSDESTMIKFNNSDSWTIKCFDHDSF